MAILVSDVQTMQDTCAELLTDVQELATALAAFQANVTAESDQTSQLLGTVNSDTAPIAGYLKQAQLQLGLVNAYLSTLHVDAQAYVDYQTGLKARTP